LSPDKSRNTRLRESSPPPEYHPLASFGVDYAVPDDVLIFMQRNQLDPAHISVEQICALTSDEWKQLDGYKGPVMKAIIITAFKKREKAFKRGKD
jgi:hypothetical protein